MFLLEEIAESMSPVGMVAAVIGCALVLVMAVLIIRERLLSADSSEPEFPETVHKESDENYKEPVSPVSSVSAPPLASAFKTYNPTEDRSS